MAQLLYISLWILIGVVACATYLLSVIYLSCRREPMMQRIMENDKKEQEVSALLKPFIGRSNTEAVRLKIMSVLIEYLDRE